MKYKTRFGGWTLQTRKERRETAEETEWAKRSGEVTISKLPTRDEENSSPENENASEETFQK